MVSAWHRQVARIHAETYVTYEDVGSQKFRSEMRTQGRDDRTARHSRNSRPSAGPILARRSRPGRPMGSASSSPGHDPVAGGGVHDDTMRVSALDLDTIRPCRAQDEVMTLSTGAPNTRPPAGWRRWPPLACRRVEMTSPSVADPPTYPHPEPLAVRAPFWPVTARPGAPRRALRAASAVTGGVHAPSRASCGCRARRRRP